MTKDELKDLLGIADEDVTDDEAVWPLIVEFVAGWLGGLGFRILSYEEAADAERLWREEMT